MQILHNAHLSYCTNIHPGESWAAHFESLKQNFPQVKAEVSPDAAMGIGLRLSNQASIEILLGDNLQEFKQWLGDNDAYVFTMNGFPYGGFHDTVVKDQVHAPDWTTVDRVAYTQRIFGILAALLPEGMEGGISTSPLSYKHWFATADEMQEATIAATKNILTIAEQLNSIYDKSGILLHLDIEPEPDGVLETCREFIDWYEQVLLPLGAEHFGDEAEAIIKRHIQLCYDVCHFAIGYEPHKEVVAELAAKGIRTGKIQISAALKASFEADNKQAILEEFAKFDEPTYLHQVIARLPDGQLARYPDLPDALLLKDDALEWRAHFHVPIFLESFGLLNSTQSDIREVLAIWKEQPFTNHLEAETYTWGVLPAELKIPMANSISRELNWVIGQLNL
ncbi:metabolite traffic protein EboE [Mucilaginibacter myungsuensis]|uniref:Metabolite traffic protein EboE n=1 Tax=Mucilaginibacter myungsuensis TaxID=649104 RepID=A0A929KU03_9SPHI|nr:metabolite traffic protein EboE [Mucilaginibacter myungsuensis]MBE9660767.1 metabolite traffic protein EboE [Mucilaginibacter myungsuensis]MDN3600812.1 metabolite traffic protein EboE [Mucilaginibacter myungsuensis]